MAAVVDGVAEIAGKAHWTFSDTSSAPMSDWSERAFRFGLIHGRREACREIADRVNEYGKTGRWPEPGEEV